MEKLFLEGRLGRDAQQKTPSNGGNPFVTFTLATNSKFKGEEKTTWYDVIMQVTNRNKGLIPYLTKGKVVYVIGDLDLSLYEANDGSKRIRASVSADSIQFPQSSQKSENNNATSEPNEETHTKTAPKPTPAPKPKTKDTDPPVDDIPMVSSSDDEDDLPF